MNTYTLARLIAAVDRVDSRKRLQKCIFLIQEKGCDLGAEYFLHFYGPYSRDLAGATDELEQAGVLDEEDRGGAWGEQYSYSISEAGKALLEKYEKTSEGKDAKEKMEPYFGIFQKLCGLDLRLLELVATIAYYSNRTGVERKVAVAKTAEFKQEDPESEVLVAAAECAEDFIPQMA